MVDRVSRPTPRFPPQMERPVARALQNEIDKLKPGFGFSSAACGADILFLEAMVERHAENSVVLPYAKDTFVRDSVDFVPNSNWRQRFDRVLEGSRVITASPEKLEIGGVSYAFCNQLTLGMAKIRAGQLDTRLVPLAVWDGMPGDGSGGTASIIENWRSAGYKPLIINLAESFRAPNGRKSENRQ